MISYFDYTTPGTKGNRRVLDWNAAYCTIGIRMTDAERKHISLHMEPETYLEINAVVHGAFGKTFAELAGESPSNAYTVLRMAQLALMDDVSRTSNEHGVIADYQQDGLEATQAAARSTLEALMPNVPLVPMRISILTFETMTPDGKPLARKFGREAVEQLTFDVDPPDSMTA